MKLKDICPICYDQPNSHSFDKLCEINGVCMLYTKPSAAKKYDDQAGILSHVNNMLISLNGKKWEWTIDGEGFTMKHALEVTTTQKILDIILKGYEESLVKIKIINMNRALKQMHSIVKPFIGSKLNHKLVWE